MSDCVRRFLFENLDIRGAFVQIDAVWQALLANRAYPDPVIRLLGEMCATTVLLADNLKQPGRLSVQSKGNGPVSLLIVDCNERRNIRCMANYQAKAAQASRLADLLGDGRITLSIRTPSMRKPHQSILSLSGNTLAEIFEHYLAQSEQLVSRFFLAATPGRAAGLFLQKMPGADERDPDGWPRIEALAATVEPAELLDLSPETLLTRLFHEETIRLFDAKPVMHHFPKDWDRMHNILRSLGRDEVYRALQANGVIVVQDELSNHEYRFDKAAIDRLFYNVPSTPPTRH